MAKVFISYSRKDLAFVASLRTLLEAAGLSVWVDIEGLYAGEEYWPEIAKALDAAAAVIFVITPDSNTSKVCAQELAHAIDRHKRIVPVLRRDVDAGALHPELAKRQWVMFREDDDPETAQNALLLAVRADWVRLRQQARLLVRAQEWHAKHGDESLLLRGRDLREAEAWLAETRGLEYGPTSLHGEYIQESRHAARRRRLRLSGAAAIAFVVIVILAWFGLDQRVASLSNLSLDDLNRGEADAAIDKLGRANAICAAFRSVFRGCPDAAMNLGSAYLDAGRYGEALGQFSRVLDATQDVGMNDSLAIDSRATTYQNRAFARIMFAELQAEPSKRLGEYDRAEADLEKAIALYQRTAAGAEGKPVAITRARIRIGRAEYDEAFKELQRAGQVSDARDIDLLLSLVHHCQGDGLNSIKHLELYIKALPGRLQDPQWIRNRDYYEIIRKRCSGAGRK